MITGEGQGARFVVECVGVPDWCAVIGKFRLPDRAHAVDAPTPDWDTDRDGLGPSSERKGQPTIR